MGVAVVVALAPAGAESETEAVLPGAGYRGSVLLERDRELERVDQCLHWARMGRGSALVVEGPAGIGKTALLAAAPGVPAGEGFRWLRARGAELEREFAFGVVRQLLEPVLAGAPVEERVRLLEGPPGVAARLLGLPGLAERGRPAAPEPSFAMLHGLYWLCANLAAQRPVALVVDNAHWADGASLRFLAFLLPRLGELPVAVLLAVRPGEAAQNRDLLAVLALDPAFQVVTVPPLTTAGVARLVAESLGAEPESGFTAACREATGGTPFLVHALVEALREEQVAPVTASSAKVQGVATVTLGRWAALRLARLGPDAVRLARAVAILERAELGQAAGLAGLAPLDAARAAELLVRAGVLTERPLAFAHPLLRGGVYREIGAADRAAEHGRAARLLADGHAGPAHVAEHLLAAAPAGHSWVVERLTTAAREAVADGAPESAAAYLRRALDEPPSREAEAGLLLELGVAEVSAGQPGWQRHLAGAVAGAGEDTTRITAALLLAQALRFHHRLAEAVEVCDGVAARVGGRDTEAHLMLEAMAVACGLLDVGTAPSVAGRARALVARARERPVPRPVVAVAACVAALANEPAGQAAELARQAVAAGPRPLPEPGEPAWFPTAMVALVFAEQYAEAQALLDAAVAGAQAAANGLVLPGVLAHRAWLALRRGDLTAAEADARALLGDPGLPTLGLLGLLARGVLVGALVERGDLDEAERQLEPGDADPGRRSQTAAILCHARGRLRLAQRRPGEALGDFLAAGEIATRTLAPSPCFLPWRSDAALAALAAGDPGPARRLSEEELELARAFGTPRALGVALRAAGLAAGSSHGERLLGDAVEVLDGPDTRLDHARALADLGALLRRSNRRADARPLLRQAASTAHHLGARPLAARAETELRATRARPRRVLITGLEALTASERRIAELAAEGLTNREIAQTLFVTARTVEGHLTSVFQKLDVKARTGLAAALAAPTHAARS
jgi:DNA-binding CsgD family transcriptional regulator